MQMLKKNKGQWSEHHLEKHKRYKENLQELFDIAHITLEMSYLLQ